MYIDIYIYINFVEYTTKTCSLAHTNKYIGEKDEVDIRYTYR